MRSGDSSWLRDLALVTEAVAWTLLLPLLTRTMSLPRLARLMWSGRSSRMRSDDVTRIARRAQRLLRREPRCLEESFLMYRFLSRTGHAPELVIGFDERRNGHAWVEVSGVRLGEPETNRFETMMTFGAGGRLAETSP
ncbi:MAG TPA: lasso peptide biosynthesis B2 protein [Thermoanaerobaculia bacterium]|nr:lasso peptide biosynthesis B2 protein [Thermoanaerobaculia bacterium]